ncbi:MAG TPA: hypothetical protein VNG53_01345 [Bacteroidia bacterium]|nr:hypothetical protein [Bacteroidia bacterium]
MGKISYSSYLIHFAVLYWINKYGTIIIPFNNQGMNLYNYIIRLLIVITITSIIAYIFYKIIEIPFQKLGKRVINYVNGITPPVEQ